MKTIRLLGLLLLLLPLHSKTLIGCSDDDDEVVAPTPAPQPDVSPRPEEPDLKVVILAVHPEGETDLFYVRTSYNAEKDILQLYRQNANGIITPQYVYLGGKTLEDEELMSEENLVVDQHDSTAPLSGLTAYWCLFGQHGYVVPTLYNNVGLTAADEGSLWTDQLGREYTIGKVTSSRVTLLPVIYKTSEGHDMRRWQTPSSAAIEKLTHSVAGTVIASFFTTGYSHTQLYPIMRSENRHFVGDGEELAEEGVYHVKDFSVSETQIGYDPATIASWFPTPSIDTALPMARFDWSYHFCGAQCCVNTTIDILREVRFSNYCATQQQTFTNTGDYKAMFMIPKALPQEGVALDRPFNSPSRSGKDIYFYRTEKYLRDVNEPIDRLVAFLHNDATDDYLIGMSAGLSLITGDTRQEKRCENIPYGDKRTDTTARLGLFSPSNNNKFYISAINASPFADRSYYLPVGYHREIDYYVSFFDPSANEGQVYWYKDGNRYVIYAHCQTQHDKLDITVPDFMNGCTLRVVEKTSSTELLSTTVQDGHFSVKYADAAANYIVLTAE